MLETFILSISLHLLEFAKLLVLLAIKVLMPVISSCKYPHSSSVALYTRINRHPKIRT